MIGKEIEVVLRGPEYFPVRGIVVAVGEDYILLQQDKNYTFVYPEEIAIMNIRRDTNERGTNSGYEDGKKDVS